MDNEFQLFPDQASTVARKVDALYWFLSGVSGFFVVLIFVLIVVFALRYRRGRRVDRGSLPTNLVLEVVWFAIPLGLTMVMFLWGAILFYHMQRLPRGTLDIEVVGKQWMWKLQHPEGKREINRLHVPRGETVRLRMISEDVIHSFYIPAFRVKMDVVPGRYTTLWFEATDTGTYHLFCAEYCGTGHSDMIGQVTVMEPSRYAEWVRRGQTELPEEVGQRLFERHRCADCHPPGPGMRGPSLAGLFGNRVQLRSGETVVADENYIRRSILRPNAQIVAGHQPDMPTFEGELSEMEILQIIEYIKSLGGEEPTETENQQ